VPPDQQQSTDQLLAQFQDAAATLTPGQTAQLTFGMDPDAPETRQLLALAQEMLDVA
jgi:hypothetical protein